MLSITYDEYLTRAYRILERLKRLDVLKEEMEEDNDDGLVRKSQVEDKGDPTLFLKFKKPLYAEVFSSTLHKYGIIHSHHSTSFYTAAPSLNTGDESTYLPEKLDQIFEEFKKTLIATSPMLEANALISPLKQLALMMDLKTVRVAQVQNKHYRGLKTNEQFLWLIDLEHQSGAELHYILEAVLQAPQQLVEP